MPWHCYCTYTEHFKSQTSCKGHVFSRTMTIYLVICEETRYCPIKLRILTGHMSKLALRNCLLSSQVRIDKAWIWDRLHIFWGTTKVSYNGSDVHLPTKILISIIDKMRMRQLMAHEFTSVIMVKQGRSWLNLENNRISGEPDTTPEEV